MLGRELTEYFRSISAAKDGCLNVVTALDYPEIDITNFDMLYEMLATSVHYDYVVNCAAITDTKGIEGPLKDKSYEVNALAVRSLAKLCDHFKTKLIHISTDYVFSEKSGLPPFGVGSTPYPVNTYGMHKLLAEQFIQTMMKKTDYTIIRVSWLYGKYNEKSFVHKFIRNCVDKMKNGIYAIPCTSDEFSFPTSCTNVCRKTYNVIVNNLSGIFHGNDFSDSDEKICFMSRLGFCNAIVDLVKNKLPTNSEIQKLACVGVNLSENGTMRYPRNSTMESTTDEEFTKGTYNWLTSLNMLISYDKQFEKWLIDTTTT